MKVPSPSPPLNRGLSPFHPRKIQNLTKVSLFKNPHSLQINFNFHFQIIEALQDKVEQSHDSDKVRIASEDTLRLIGLALQKRIKDEKYEIVHFPTNPENYLSFCDLTEVVLHPERKMWHTFVMQDQTDVLENLHGMIELVLKFPVRTESL